MFSLQNFFFFMFHHGYVMFVSSKLTSVILFPSPGSSHSDKEVESVSTPEKLRPTERKRKRKGDDANMSVGGPLMKGGGGGNARPLADSKKINEYFVKHPTTSPLRHATSPPSYPMFPPTPQLPAPPVSVPVPTVPPDYVQSSHALMHPPRGLPSNPSLCKQVQVSTFSIKAKNLSYMRT